MKWLLLYKGLTSFSLGDASKAEDIVYNAETNDSREQEVYGEDEHNESHKSIKYSRII